jgi:hypothetical protein
MNVLISCLIMTTCVVAYATAQSLPPPGSSMTVALQCLGKINNPSHVYLDGRTLTGTTGLAPSTTGVYSGTHWLLTNNGKNGFTLKCLGAVPSAWYQYLNGGTERGTVTLAAGTGCKSRYLVGYAIFNLNNNRRTITDTYYNE